MRSGSALLALVAMAIVAPSAAFAQPSQSAPTLGSCPDGNPMFFVVPGTSTCLRIGGSVASEYDVGFAAPRMALATGGAQVATRHQDLSASRIDARLSVDARTQTELGPVRVYVSVRKPGDRLR